MLPEPAHAEQSLSAMRMQYGCLRVPPILMPPPGLAVSNRRKFPGVRTYSVDAAAQEAARPPLRGLLWRQLPTTSHARSGSRDSLGDESGWRCRPSQVISKACAVLKTASFFELRHLHRRMEVCGMRQRHTRPAQSGKMDRFLTTNQQLDYQSNNGYLQRIQLQSPARS